MVVVVAAVVAGVVVGVVVDVVVDEVMVVAACVMLEEMETVRPRVPVTVVPAPIGIEALSATRFHFLKVGRVKTWGMVVASSTTSI